MSLPYGFMLAPGGHITIDQEKANTVRAIYQQYLSGMSLKGIADFLSSQNIPSSRGKAQWTQAVISDLLSNQRYIGSIVSFDEFFIVQGEKGKRSNLNEDTNQRKATRYNSQSVLSGLLVCGECGRNYRRITRPSGEVVWRCANRVEYGKRFCKHSPSISEQQIKDAICKEIGMGAFDEQAAKKYIDFITIRPDCQRQPEIVGFRRKGMSFFAGQHTSVYSLNHYITCRFEARQALIYQLALGLTGKNDMYNYSKAVHVYPPFFDITCSAKNYKIAPALTQMAN